MKVTFPVESVRAGLATGLWAAGALAASLALPGPAMAQGRGSAAPVTAADLPRFFQETLLRIWQGIWSVLPQFLLALMVIALTWLGVRLMALAWGRAMTRSSLRYSLQALFLRFIRFFGWLAGLLVAAVIVFPRLTPTDVLGSLGVASLAFGFIFKEFFENFLAGILILWRFPMEVGDFIECQGIEGQVEDISVRMTLIRQVSDELVLVPNKILTANTVRILTSRPKRRVLEVISLGYGHPVEEMARVMRSAAETCARVDKGHRIEALARCICPDGVDMELAWWTDPSPYDVRLSRDEVLAAVKKALEEAGIGMSTTSRTLTFASPLDVRGQREDGPDGEPDDPGGAERQAQGK